MSTPLHQLRDAALRRRPRCADCGRLDELRTSDDAAVTLCRPCLAERVSVAIERVPYVQACRHGTPVEAPFCIACRLMGWER